MAFRSDVSIDWVASPRIITIAAPSTSATIQDLSDTLRVLEGNRILPMSRDYILDNEGKFDLGTKLTGISLRLINAKLAFEARPGPTWAECAVTGGNLASVDDVGASQWPIEFTNYTSVTFESDTSAALIPGTGGALTPTQETELTTAATQSTAAAASSATAATEATVAATQSTLGRKYAGNRAVISSDDLTVTIYDDDDVTPILVLDISADKRERVPQ